MKDNGLETLYHNAGRRLGVETAEDWMPHMSVIYGEEFSSSEKARMMEDISRPPNQLKITGADLYVTEGPVPTWKKIDEVRFKA